MELRATMRAAHIIPVLYGQVPSLDACCKTDIPNIEWERCCLERIELMVG